MLLQATDPNSKESFLIQFSGNNHLLESLFNPVLFQLSSLSFFSDEEEYLSNYGAEVGSGEVSSDEIQVSCVAHRIHKIVEIGWDGKHINRSTKNWKE
jgi:hypothetical protein